jgi:type IV pilus assembly protein PilQ
MRADAAYSLRKEADMAYLEFTHPSDLAVGAVASAPKAAAPAQAPTADTVVEQQLVQPQSTNGKRAYVGRKVTLEFADAEVRKIFQLLSEVSNKNFVLGDEVSGNISLKLVNVPWDQALDIIIDTKGLDKREEGNIILIRGKGKFKSLLDEEQEIRKAALKSEPLETRMFDVNYSDITTITTQLGALKTDRGSITPDSRTNKIIVKDVKAAIQDMELLLKNFDVPERQVMIEARIVEATTAFTRSLGVNWGVHYRDGSSSIAGINSLDTSFGGLASNIAPTTGVSGQPGASAGISFGTLTSNIKLDMRLNAAVSAGLVRIVSTPRVATLNHKSAKITQGQQIPYTSSTSDKVETKFIEAALSLEVTPHINPNGTIVLKIDAKNDSPGTGGSPPPINKKQATTEMMLFDGETTVIGGIFVDRESKNDEGVPFLKDIPFLGGLFKSDSVEKTRNELLIFITPRILVSTK